MCPFSKLFIKKRNVYASRIFGARTPTQSLGSEPGTHVANAWGVADHHSGTLARVTNTEIAGKITHQRTFLEYRMMAIRRYSQGI